MLDLIARIAQDLNVQQRQVSAAVDLLDAGASVPFIARYRKEATGSLDDVQLRALQAQLIYGRELDARRAAVRQSIEQQGQLTPALRAALEAASSKQALEDLYAPYKPKRRTRAQIAREAGLAPLADALWADPCLAPEASALAYVQAQKTAAGDDFCSVQAVLDGARDILCERWGEDATLVQSLREWLWQAAWLRSQRASTAPVAAPGPSVDAAKFSDYFDHAEPLARLPSHRALALLRGRAQQVLDLKLVLQQDLDSPENQPQSHVSPAQAATKQVARGAPDAALQTQAQTHIAAHLGWRHQGRAADDWLARCLGWTWRVKLSLALERDLLGRLREQAEAVAIDVFANNLRDLLLAAPAGPRVVLGLDPGIRTGVKVAVVDATGRLLETATVYPHEPRRDWAGSLRTLADLCRRHAVELIAIGNGTASRETDRLAADLIEQFSQGDAAQPRMQKVVVNEAGASIYSASEWASQELPDVDVSLRGAASIARRLQDPLAELVKIEPKSIGVGQYQHDLNPVQLARALDAVVEDAVNKVGVDVNTASVPLLERVSGLSPSVARALVRWRDTHGAFRQRRQLLEVSGLGPKTFEQAAGFLRIRAGDDPLDATGVHPESYPLVQAILARVGGSVGALMGRSDWQQGLSPAQFTNERFGLPTVRDIFAELEKPGRDPRGTFAVARWSEGVHSLADLKAGLWLEGVVTNVAAFGAFVDIGVHQDGLVHVSQLSNRFVQDASEVVKTGQVVRVQVLDVDVARARIALSMKPETQPGANPAPARGAAGAAAQRAHAAPVRGSARSAPQSTAMAQAFAKLKR